MTRLWKQSVVDTSLAPKEEKTHLLQTWPHCYCVIKYSQGHETLRMTCKTNKQNRFFFTECLTCQHKISAQTSQTNCSKYGVTASVVVKRWWLELVLLTEDLACSHWVGHELHWIPTYSRVKREAVYQDWVIQQDRDPQHSYLAENKMHEGVAMVQSKPRPQSVLGAVHFFF